MVSGLRFQVSGLRLAILVLENIKYFMFAVLSWALDADPWTFDFRYLQMDVGLWTFDVGL